MQQHLQKSTTERASTTAQEVLSRTRAYEAEWAVRRASRVRPFLATLPSVPKHRAEVASR